MDAELMIEIPSMEAVGLQLEECAAPAGIANGVPHPPQQEQPSVQQEQRQQDGQQDVQQASMHQQQAGAWPAEAAAETVAEAAGAAAGEPSLAQPALVAAEAAEPGTAGQVAAGAAPAGQLSFAEADAAAPPQQTTEGAAAGSGAQAAETAGGTAGTAAASGPAEEEDELAANLLSNMAAWQSELDTFQAALRRCMESTPAPGAGAGAAGSPATVDESGRGTQRLMHSGPKGITGFRGVTQHKRTKRYEANVWMDHKQMYLGAFDAPEQAAHAHDIGALCSGKARTEALNFPLTDYDQLLPMLYSLPHAQVVAALRGYGRLPTARPPGGISSGRLYNSPSARSASAAAKEEEDGEAAEGATAAAQRPRRTRKMSSASPGGSRGLPPPPAAATPALASPPAQPMDWQAALQGPQIKQEVGGQTASSGQQQQQQAEGAASGAGEAAAAANGLEPAAATAAAGGPVEPSSPGSLAAAQQAQLQALSAALVGDLRAPSALSGAPAVAVADGKPPVPRPPQKAGAGSRGAACADAANPVGAFESVLWRIMAQSHELPRPESAPGDGAVLRPLHSGPKGQSGYKGVTLYKRCLRYNAHIWLGKQTHIGTFHTAEQAAVAHDVMELWRNENAQGLNFAAEAYSEIVPLLKALSEADALAALRNYSRSPSAAAAAAASGATSQQPSQGPSRKAQKTQGGSSSKATAAAGVAAAAAAQPAPQPPSLRRRQRKPQHVGSGGGGGPAAEAEESSGGSVPAQRQSAGSLMWYMLEQEKSVADDLEEEMSDPDFSPVEAAHQGGKRQRAGSESPTNEPLGFHPRSSASVARALQAELPADQAVVGARPPRPGSSHRWGVAISLRGQAAWFGRLDRQRAAVAADLSLLWRRTALSAAGDEDDKDSATPFNIPDAGYEQDAGLMEQIRRIKTAPQLCQFLVAVVPQDPPAPAGGAAAAAAAAAAVLAAPRLQAPPAPATQAAAVAAAAGAGTGAGALVGARKRKQQTLLEEARANKLQALATPKPAVAPGGAVAAVAPSRLALSSTAALAAAAAGVNGQLPQQDGGQQQQAQAQQHQDDGGMLVQAAAAAVQQADVGDSGSMLGALKQLVAAGKGGRLLQDVVSGWDAYPLMQQQDLFGALQLPVSCGDWEQLEERLQVALDLASLI